MDIPLKLKATAFSGLIIMLKKKKSFVENVCQLKESMRFFLRNIIIFFNAIRWGGVGKRKGVDMIFTG